MSASHEVLRARLRILLPALVLAASVGIAMVIWITRPEVDVTQPIPMTPIVEVRELAAESVRLEVRAEGTVRPHTETALIAEVAGRVIEVSASLDAGGFFDAGEVLIQIERRDYELACTRASAEIADARYALEVEAAEAAAAIEEWSDRSDTAAPELVRREPQLAAARARLAATEANLESAQRDLARTRITAPYAGRVATKQVDVGQFVNRGTTLAQIYAVDYAEVRLPLQDRDLAFLEMPIDFRNIDQNVDPTPVHIRAQFGGRMHTWSGRIVRTEGSLDATSRMLHAIAQIDDPYGVGTNGDARRPPLLVGMFVEATLLGRHVDDVFVLPRGALHRANRVLLVDDANRIRVREVEILRIDDERVYVCGGLANGERLCLTRLDIYTDGMEVRLRPAPTATEVEVEVR